MGVKGKQTSCQIRNTFDRVKSVTESKPYGATEGEKKRKE